MVTDVEHRLQKFGLISGKGLRDDIYSESLNMGNSIITLLKQKTRLVIMITSHVVRKIIPLLNHSVYRVVKEDCIKNKIKHIGDESTNINKCMAHW